MLLFCFMLLVLADCIHLVRYFAILKKVSLLSSNSPLYVKVQIMPMGFPIFECQ